MASAPRWCAVWSTIPRLPTTVVRRRMRILRAGDRSILRHFVGVDEPVDRAGGVFDLRDDGVHAFLRAEDRILFGGARDDLAIEAVGGLDLRDEILAENSGLQLAGER